MPRLRLCTPAIACAQACPYPLALSSHSLSLSSPSLWPPPAPPSRRRRPRHFLRSALPPLRFGLTHLLSPFAPCPVALALVHPAAMTTAIAQSPRTVGEKDQVVFSSGKLAVIETMMVYVKTRNTPNVSGRARSPLSAPPATSTARPCS